MPFPRELSMGQIDLFEPDHTEKAPYDLLDDKALSEILELPDDNTLSEILEIPDSTDGDSKADNDSDISEVDLKVETKDCVRHEWDLDHENEFSLTDSNLVAPFKPEDEGVQLSDHSSVVAQSFLDNDGSVAKQSLFALGQGSSIAQTAHDHTLSNHNVNVRQAHISQVIPDSVKSNHVNNGKSELETATDSKTQKDEKVGSSPAKMIATKTDLSPVDRCLSPQVDISIPAKPKSNSLASRRSKETNNVSVVPENVQNPKQDKNANSHKISVVPNADLDKISIVDKTEPNIDARAHTQLNPRHLRTSSHQSKLTISSKLDKPISHKSEKDSVAKQEGDLAKKDKSVAPGNSASSPVSQSLPKNHSRSSQVTRSKQTNVVGVGDKSPSTRVYMHTAEKPRNHQHQAVVTVKDETVTATKDKLPRQTRMEAVLKTSRNKPTFV